MSDQRPRPDLRSSNGPGETTRRFRGRDPSLLLDHQDRADRLFLAVETLAQQNAALIALLARGNAADGHGAPATAAGEPRRALTPDDRARASAAGTDGTGRGGNHRSRPPPAAHTPPPGAPESGPGDVPLLMERLSTLTARLDAAEARLTCAHFRLDRANTNAQANDRAHAAVAQQLRNELFQANTIAAQLREDARSTGAARAHDPAGPHSFSLGAPARPGAAAAARSCPTVPTRAGGTGGGVSARLGAPNSAPPITAAAIADLLQSTGALGYDPRPPNRNGLPDRRPALSVSPPQRRREAASPPVLPPASRASLRFPTTPIPAVAGTPAAGPRATYGSDGSSHGSRRRRRSRSPAYDPPSPRGSRFTSPRLGSRRRPDGSSSPAPRSHDSSHTGRADYSRPGSGTSARRPH